MHPRLFACECGNCPRTSGGKASLKTTLVVSETGLPGKKNEFGRHYLKSWSYEGLPNKFLTDGMRPVTKFLSG